MKYLRRFTGWLTGMLLIAAVVIGLVVITFFEAMNLTNIRIVLKSGMAYRAQVLMGVVEDTDRGTYFTAAADYGSDAEALRARYADYDIRGINHNLEPGFVWVWPQWGSREPRSVTVEVSESIPSIDGRAKGDRAEALVNAGGSQSLNPPRWNDTRYSVTLEQNPDNQQWQISRIEPITQN